MKKTVFILSSVFVMTACNNSNKDTPSDEDKKSNIADTTTVGGEKDEHGCLTSAGETWSQLKQGCVQIFNVGQRLNPIVQKDGEAVISAFILFNTDKTEAELFLPNAKSNSILKKNGAEIYEGGEYKFDGKDTSLYISGTKSYTAQELKK